ncbi:hypothetical protein OROHE_015453 [Orobanche hederae]
MSDNPLQHLLQAFGKVSECVQSHISQFLLRPGLSSPLLSKNQSPLVSLSSHYADSHLQPAKILVKSSSPTTKEELGTATWTFLHTLAAQSGGVESNMPMLELEPRARLQNLKLDLARARTSSILLSSSSTRLGTWYPDKPNRQQKKDVKELIAILSRMYPCKECADHFKEVISKLKCYAAQILYRLDLIMSFPNGYAMCTMWLIEALGKLVFPCERVDARWGKLECQQRACDLQGTSMGFDDELK